MTLRFACLVVLALGMAACSSAKTKSMVEAKPYKQDLELAIPAAKAFDALVAVINANNMRMATVSKDAGVLEVAPSPVSAADMDRYCGFPAHDSDGKPTSTFEAYAHEHSEKDKPAGNGSVELRFLVKTLTPETCSVNLTADWTANYAGGTVACDSKGVLEAQIFDQLKTQLLTPGK
jgi:hypothetical protein